MKKVQTLTPTDMPPQSYTPPPEILKKYAELIVRFGMQNRYGRLPKKGSIIRFNVPEAAKPLYFHLQRAILKAGYQPLGIYLPNDTEMYNLSEDYYRHASERQLSFMPEAYVKGMLDQIDGTIFIIADNLPHALDKVDPKKVLRRSHARKNVVSWTFRKIDEGKLTRTVALYGTDAAAREAGLTPKQHWQQIIRACYLDKKDPVKEWGRINTTVQQTATKLTNMQIKSVHVKGKDMDLHIGIGKNRQWRAGGGDNIPSFEVFTSPNWREVNGWARFNQPHYRYGKKIEGIELWFKDGIVVKSKARRNHDLLKSMLKTPGGNKLGEFSLTDARLSRITKYMAEILYDENMGGRYGNTHVALGMAYRDCFIGNMAKMTEKHWEKLGYNDSVVHSDVISTTNRTATATLQNGDEVVIYKNGRFTI